MVFILLQRRSMPSQVAQILHNSVFQCQATQVLPGADHLCSQWCQLVSYKEVCKWWPLVPPANPQVAQVLPGQWPPGFGWDSAAHPQLAPAPTRQLQGFPRRVCAASTAVVLYQPPRASDIQPDPTKPCKHEQWCHLFRVWVRQNGYPGSVHHRANSSNNDRSFKDQRISISGVSRRRRRPSAFSDVWPIRRRYILVVFTSKILFLPSFTSLCPDPFDIVLTARQIHSDQETDGSVQQQLWILSKLTNMWPMMTSVTNM